MSHTAQITPPETLFPLVRQLSCRVTPVLARSRLTPNQISVASMLAGLMCAWCLAHGARDLSLLAALLLIVSYVLDNCDGEIARLKSLATPAGMVLDSSIDWIVHAAFFAGLGLGVAEARGEPLWAWLGWAAVAGTTINTVLSIPMTLRAARQGVRPDRPSTSAVTVTGWLDKAVFFLREMSRADFCFLVLLLAALDLLWLLLPAGAVGAQVYWLMGLVKGADRYRV